MINLYFIDRNIPRSISIAVPIVTCLYVFMNIAYMTVLEKDEMIKSVAVGLTFGERALGPFSFLIPLGVALSTFGCALSIQFGCTRLCYVSARGEMFNEIFEAIYLNIFYCCRKSHASAIELYPCDKSNAGTSCVPPRNFSTSISSSWWHCGSHRICIIFNLVSLMKNIIRISQ